ncbi:hypothetical protein FB451DRAFT_1368594 [Mycena latifolia]|nr:hypothetical protein FB451DRAFT_1368594 [Mycena latifolia]
MAQGGCWRQETGDHSARCPERNRREFFASKPPDPHWQDDGKIQEQTSDDGIKHSLIPNHAPPPSSRVPQRASQRRCLQPVSRSPASAPPPMSQPVGFFFEVDTGLSESQYSAESIAGANYSEATIPQDLAFVSDLLNDIRANYCIGDTRVYATGCHVHRRQLRQHHRLLPPQQRIRRLRRRLGLLHRQRGPADSTPCTPAHSPLPMLEIHGEADPDVAYAGGVEPAIPDWLSWWTARNACPTRPWRHSLMGTCSTMYGSAPGCECVGPVGALEGGLD